MRRTFLTLAATLALGLSLGAQPKAAKAARPAPSPQVTQGRKLFLQGDFKGALQLFRQAAEENPSDKLALKLKTLTARVIATQRVVRNEKHPRWAAAVAWLHKVYNLNKLPRLALPLDEKAWKKYGDFASGLRLGETLSNLGKDKEALSVYQAVLKKRNHPEVRALAAVLSARLGLKDQARKLLEGLPAQAESQGLCYNKACAWALLGEKEKAARLLERSFQLTPKPELARAKKQALSDPDLAPLKGTPELAKALQAKSTVEGRPSKCAGCSGCSGGSCKEGEGSCDKDKDSCEKDGK